MNGKNTLIACCFLLAGCSPSKPDIVIETDSGDLRINTENIKKFDVEQFRKEQQQNFERDQKQMQDLHESTQKAMNDAAGL